MFNPLEALETRELFSAMPGIYSGGELLAGERYAIQADANLMPSVRNALDEGRVDIEVVLDPGETYRLDPRDGSSGRVINDLYLNRDKLTFTADPEADADGSGGRANLLVGKTEGGVRRNPIYIDADRGGELVLNGVDLSAENHASSESIRFVINHGAGGVELNDSTIAPSRVPVVRPDVPGGGSGGVGVKLQPGADAGIYEDGQLLEEDRYSVRSGENILPSIRRALDSGHRDILVALDPGEKYYLNPQEERGQPQINDIFLNGADLAVAAIEEADADGSGGRAQLVVQRGRDGSFNNPFYLHERGYGNLDLENVDLTAEDRRSGEFVGFISHYGDGLVRLVNSSLEAPTRRFEGADIVRPELPAPEPIPDAGRPANPTPPVGDVTQGSGIYLDGVHLDGYDLRTGANILPVIRRAMDTVSNRIEVRLDPGATYAFSPVDKGDGYAVENLFLGGADLKLTAAASADADRSGGFATLEVGPSKSGFWSNVFFLNHTGVGKLTLDGISMTMPERTPDLFRDFIVWRGGGELNVIDSKLSGARNNIDVSGQGGPKREGADVRIVRSIITYSNAPDRDLEFAPGRTGNPANGVYARNYNTFVVEDSVFYHNGWRDDAFLNTHGSPYSHALYLSAGSRASFDPADTQITNTIFSDNAANAGQLRQGGIVEDSFFVNSPFGISLSAGKITGSAFVSGDTVWPRDGVSSKGYQRWIHRGGYAIQIDQDRAIETKRLGQVTIQNNTFADASTAHRLRGPILHEIDRKRPQPLTVSGNYELNWVDYQPGTRGNNYSGVGIDRFNRGSTALDGHFGSRFKTVDDIIDAAVNRERGAYGTDGVPEARDLAAFYRERALKAAG